MVFGRFRGTGMMECYGVLIWELGGIWRRFLVVMLTGKRRRREMEITAGKRRRSQPVGAHVVIQS